MKKIKVGVIGVGYLGKFHAEKYAQSQNAELVGIVDTDAETRDRIAQDLQAESCDDVTGLFGRVDAVSIVVPTIHHHRLAKQCLEQGIHVLLEKPITESLEQADELIELAARNDVILQVGHIERFNPAVTAVKALLKSPRYLSAARSAPFTMRCTDVNVILDLMIHDLDIVMHLAGSDPAEVSAAGASVITRQIDTATARIVFKNGCVADVAASRISEEKKRILRVFDGNSLYTSDYQTQKATRAQGSDGSVCELIPADISSERKDTLQEEIRAFLQSITNKTRPPVNGADGRKALALAQLITGNIESGITGFVPL